MEQRTRERRVSQDPKELRHRRINAGLSMQELAKRSGVSDATICRLENSQCSATSRTLRLLAQGLDCEIADLRLPEAQQ